MKHKHIRRTQVAEDIMKILEINAEIVKMNHMIAKEILYTPTVTIKDIKLNYKDLEELKQSGSVIRNKL